MQGESGSSFHHGLFVTSLSWPFWTDLAVQAGSLFTNTEAEEEPILPKTLVFMFQLLSCSWKASTFNQEPSEFPWKVTFLYLSLTLSVWVLISVAKLFGFWRKSPFLAYSSLCSWSSWLLQNPIRKESKECGSGWGPLCCPSLDSQQLARHQWQSWQLSQLEIATEFQAACFQRSLLTPLKTKDCYHISKQAGMIERSFW